MLLYILLGLVLLIALALVIASTKPNTVHYERSIVIQAPAERIAPYVVDFRKWAAWSPWEKMEPDMKRTFTGPNSGVGAQYAWDAKGRAGAGSMEVLEAAPSLVKIDLRFIRPFKNECIASFHFTPQAGGTQVRWTMDGPNLMMGKIFSTIMNMDKMIGKDFEAGLTAMKAAVEKG